MNREIGLDKVVYDPLMLVKGKAQAAMYCHSLGVLALND